MKQTLSYIIQKLGLFVTLKQASTNFSALKKLLLILYYNIANNADINTLKLSFRFFIVANKPGSSKSFLH